MYICLLALTNILIHTFSISFVYLPFRISLGKSPPRMARSKGRLLWKASDLPCQITLWVGCGNSHSPQAMLPHSWRDCFLYWLAPHHLGPAKFQASVWQISFPSEAIKWIQSFKSSQPIWYQLPEFRASKLPSWNAIPHPSGEPEGSGLECVYFTLDLRTKSSHPRCVNGFDLSQDCQAHHSPHQWFRAPGLICRFKAITK